MASGLAVAGIDQSLSDRAYFAIRELIVTLELAPGSLLREQDLMTRLGVSRTPVREALRSLADERLVEVYPRRGMFVAGVDVRNLAALSEVRVQLEPFAAGLAAERRTPADLERLDQLVDRLDRIGAAPRERDLMILDQAVHEAIYQIARNAFLAGVLSQHYTHALRIWFLALDRVTTLGQAVLEHRALLCAVRDGDVGQATAAMLQHVDGFEGAMRRLL
ncbi:MAG: GntR family transcriptional regulator [Actinomycetes bacterium]